MSEWLVIIPFATFFLILAGEWLFPSRDKTPRHGLWDWVIHLSGFFFQGAVIPLLGYFLATRILPVWWPGGEGSLALGWWGAFLLNFVVVDLLYYWQHRLFHRVPALWQMHQCHHTAKRVNVWVTSRNTLVMHFFFVYVLVNPVLGYLVDRPEAYFVGVTLTASLDLLRHASLDFSPLPLSGALARWLGLVFVLPSTHHRHHRTSGNGGNFGANLIVWDRLFGTFLPERVAADPYGVSNAPRPAAQWLFPFVRRKF